MIKKLTKSTCLTVVFLVSLWITLFQVPNQCHSEQIDIEIDIAPATLNLQSDGVIATVHTNIDYDVVAASTVTLNDKIIQTWKADNRGNFVAKFSMDEIKSLDGLVIGDYNTLTLFGITRDGDTFLGMQDIMVIDIIPSGK